MLSYSRLGQQHEIGEEECQGCCCWEEIEANIEDHLLEDYIEGSGGE